MTYRLGSLPDPTRSRSPTVSPNRCALAAEPPHAPMSSPVAGMLASGPPVQQGARPRASAGLQEDAVLTDPVGRRRRQIGKHNKLVGRAQPAAVLPHVNDALRRRLAKSKALAQHSHLGGVHIDQPAVIDTINLTNTDLGGSVATICTWSFQS